MSVSILRSFMSFWTGIVGIILLASVPAAAQTARRTFTHDRDVETLSEWTNFPRWNGSLLAGYENNYTSGPVIWTFNKQGKHDEFLFHYREARIGIADMTVSPSGEFAIVGSALTAKGTTFLARIGADGKQVVTDIWPYCAMVVAFATDGTVWTVGHLKDEDNTRVVANHVMRRFDASGKMLSSTTVVMRRRQTDETSFLTASRDRIGWFTREGKYIEFSLDGKEMARYDGPPVVEERDIAGVALNEENDVVASRFRDGKAEFLFLDRLQRRWVSALLPREFTSHWTRVLGFDGGTLVTTPINGKLRRFTMRPSDP